MGVPGKGLIEGLKVTAKTLARRSVTEQYPDVQPELPPQFTPPTPPAGDPCVPCPPPDPPREAVALEEELVLADLEVLERRLEKLEKGDVKSLMSKVEWMSRLKEVERILQTKAGDRRGEQVTENIEIAACKQYSEVGESRSLFYALQQAGKVDRVLDDASIRAAIHEPPKNTRAVARVKILEDYEVASSDWAEVRVLTEDGGSETIELPDPYSTKIPI